MVNKDVYIYIWHSMPFLFSVCCIGLGQPQPRLHMDSPDIPVLHQRGQFVGVSCASISLQHVYVIVNWSPSYLIAMLWFPEYKTLGY